MTGEEMEVAYCKSRRTCMKSFLMWLDCRRLGLDHAELVRFFAEEAHLGLNNGEIYGVPGYCHMRLNVGAPRARLEQAMHQLEAAVNALK